MSYILEALKKSEQERQQGHVPGLQTIQPQLPEPSRSSEKWPYIAIGVLTLALVFVLGWIRPWGQGAILDQDQQVETTESKADSAVPIVAEARTANTTNTAIEILPAPQAYSLKSNAAVQDVMTEPPSLELDSVPHLRDMPSLIQQAIPDMEFAGHVYTSNSAQRSVIINGRSMSEGETLVEGLRVEQITRKGVVFSYQDQLFQVPILQDWAFD